MSRDHFPKTVRAISMFMTTGSNKEADPPFQPASRAMSRANRLPVSTRPENPRCHVPKAAQFSLTLYVNALGWSFTSGGEARPGPILLAVQGDQVDVTMTSEDLLPHGFFIDYNGNGVADSGDFVSPQTSGTIQFSIPADTLGTYTYGDQVVTLNTGTWVTRVNSPPQASFHAPTAATARTVGKTHHISLER